MSNSIKKAFSIISVLSASELPMRLTDICRELGMNKTTVFRYLETLEALNLIEKRDNYFRLGLKLFELGNKVPVRNLLTEKIYPYLQGLSGEVEETINLACFFDGKALYLAKAESERKLQLKSVIGDTLPLYCTSLGKSILSILDPPVLRGVVEKLDLKPQTDKTITDRKALLTEVQKVQKEGFGVENQEFEYKLVCVAVPLKIASLDFFGALSISGPIERMDETYINRLVKKLIETRDRILINL